MADPTLKLVVPELNKVKRVSNAKAQELLGWAPRSREDAVVATAVLGAFWAILCILIDLAGWILIPHPWAMTFKEFYVDYQPWITLIYLVIFFSPIVAARLKP